MTSRDQEEQDLRIDQMTINIEKMRADLSMQQKQLEWETRKFILPLVASLGAACAGGAAALGLVLHLTGKW